MHPVLTVLEWHGVHRAIGSYGALIALAVLIGSALTLRAAARSKLDAGAVITALAGGIACGFVGAYAASVLVLWAQLGSVAAALQKPGIVFYGGAMAGGAGFALLARALGIPWATALDQTLPGLPLAQAIGRLGCLLGGCCYGKPTSAAWSITYTHALAPAAHPSLARHPWPLYEAACLLVLAVLFAAPQRFAGRPGRRAAMYVMLYAAVRCSLEPWRGDPARGLLFHGACSVAQIVALVTAVAACTFLYVRRRATLCAASPPV
jgi:phosphatidylglycerol:prolipoprotein diacylglycerol transferase